MELARNEVLGSYINKCLAAHVLQKPNAATQNTNCRS